MAVNSVLTPFVTFNDLSGVPIENGFIYIGQPGFEARATPKASFFDVALTIPTGTASGAAIRTRAGVPINTSNSPAMFYVDGDYSITVCDRNGVRLYGALNMTLALNVGGVVGPVLWADGNLGAVGGGFIDEPNTGFVRPGAATLQTVVNGVLVSQQTPTGTVFAQPVSGSGFDSGVLAVAQPLDADLTAVAGLATTGILTRTGAGTAAVRTLTAGTGISISDGDGVAGNPTISVSSAGATLLETLTMTGTIVTMAARFSADKSYLFEVEDLAHNNAASRILTIALYGETAAAFSTDQPTGNGFTNTQFYYASQVLKFPKRTQKLLTVEGINFATSVAVGTNTGSNYTTGRLGALIKWGTAQSVSHAQFALDGAGSFTGGTIKVWEF